MVTQDHVTAGVGGVSVTTMLVPVIEHLQTVNDTVASSEAGLIVLFAGAVWATISYFFKKDAPPAFVQGLEAVIHNPDYEAIAGAVASGVATAMRVPSTDAPASRLSPAPTGPPTSSTSSGA